RAKRDEAVRRAHEKRARGKAQARTRSEVDLREALALVDEEVQHLPERHRAAFVLCCLEGKGVPEAARQLGWTEAAGAVKLTPGRKKLRERLSRRGVTLTAALAALALARHTASAAPAALLHSTTRAALSVAAGPAATGALTPKAAALTE